MTPDFPARGVSLGRFFAGMAADRYDAAKTVIEAVEVVAGDAPDALHTGISQRDGDQVHYAVGGDVLMTRLH